ncbi:hypothetical protein GCM10025876_18880 [Demequina litorisediminis]|uniref:Uncharacterized protein n=1 Tax=Demequina litorisediminis TaxID=1849022 RepID=A0ABQ6IG43_9MICO|nr:hypothetical protein GCM10025876_18880 [Demequina litorisediminis]
MTFAQVPEPAGVIVIVLDAGRLLLEPCGAPGGGGAASGGSVAVRGGGTHDLRRGGRADAVRLRIDVDYVRDDARHVVGRACREGKPHEGVGAVAGVGDVGKGLRDRVAAHDAGQAVGAQHPAVAWARLAHRDVHGNVRIDIAEDAQQHRPLGVVLGIGRTEATGVHQVLHKVVVGGDLVERAVAQQVGARVADVRHRQRGASAQEGRHRGAKARELWVVRCALDNLGVRLRDGVLEFVEGLVGAVRLAVERRQAPHRDRGCDVASRGAAHTVGDHQQVGTGEGGVLVVGAHQPHVGARGEVEGKEHAQAPRLERGRAQAQVVASLEWHRVTDALVVEVCAVGRTQVLHPPLVAFGEDPAVLGGAVVVIDDEGAGG